MSDYTANNPRPIIYKGIFYRSVSYAARQLNTSRGRLRQAIMAGTYKGKLIAYGVV